MKRILVFILCSLCVSHTIYANEEDAYNNKEGTFGTGYNISVGPRVAIFSGLGLEAATKVHPNFMARTSINYIGLSLSNKDGKSLKYKVRFQNLLIPFLVNYHPFEEYGLMFSLGLGYQNLKIAGRTGFDGDLGKIVFENGNEYDIQGKISAKVDVTPLNKVVPIFGFGYDSSINDHENSRWSFNIELGGMYVGGWKAKGNVNATVTAAGLTEDRYKDLIKDIQDEFGKKEFSDKDKRFKILPFISIGVRYMI